MFWRIKKIVSIALVLTLCVSFGVSADMGRRTDDIDITDETNIYFYLEPCEELFSGATMDDNFEEDSVIVVLNRDISRDNDRNFTTKNFQDIGAIYVEDLIRLKDWENEYAQRMWTAERQVVLSEGLYSEKDFHFNGILTTYSINSSVFFCLASHAIPAFFIDSMA